MIMMMMIIIGQRQAMMMIVQSAHLINTIMQQHTPFSDSGKSRQLAEPVLVAVVIG